MTVRRDRTRTSTSVMSTTHSPTGENNEGNVMSYSRSDDDSDDDEAVRRTIATATKVMSNEKRTT